MSRSPASDSSPDADESAWPELPASGLVPYFFGLTGHTELPGTALVTLLKDCGLSESNARSLIARLRLAGQLTSRAEGRRAMYRLDGEMAATFQRIAARGERAAWDGGFHGVLFSVPESVRSYRDKLRRALDYSGYGQLRNGLMIHPTGRWDRVSHLVDEAPEGATVYQLRLSLELADARAVARDAWELDRLAAAMRVQAAHLRTAAGRVPMSGPAAVHDLVAALRPALYLLLVDPRLPTELIPDGWPAGDLGAAIGQLNGAYAPLLGPYLADLCG